MAKKNLVIRVREGCSGSWWDIILLDGKKILMEVAQTWERKYAAIRNAKALAKQTGIPYDDKIYKQHGC